MTAIALPRRFYSLLWLAIFLALAVFFLCFKEDAWGSIPRPPASWRIPFTTDDGVLSSWRGGGSSSGNNSNEPLRIALLESTGTHDEVAAALVHAFGGQENTQLDLYFAHQRFHMKEIMGNFSLAANVTTHSFNDFPSAMRKQAPHVLVSTTCEFDVIRPKAQAPMVELLRNASTHLFCTIHHADRWGQSNFVHMARSWAEQGRLDFIGLSQHTIDYLLNKTVPQWFSIANLTARVLPPVFPVDVPEFDVKKGISLAMQGDYSSGRRDYNGIFNHLGSVIRKANESTVDHTPERVALHVIGHGKTPQVPEHVKDNIYFDQGLSYPDFYALLSKSFSIIPAFASDTYYDRKASSTVPASLIAGAPLVASEELLQSYTYLPRDATWVARPGEGEMDVIERVVSDRAGFLKRRQRVQETTNNLMEENRANVKAWISEALAKLERNN
ncbi:hypothetical protein ACJ41O_000691 [Fusarium nematophilum]